MKAKMNELTEVERAYLAGLIDGEGCITINRTTTHCGTPVYTMRVLVTQANKPYLDYWRDKVGMGIISKGHNTQSVWWCWQICQQEAASLLRAVEPYIVLKRDQLDIALRFIATKNRPGGDGYRSRTPDSVLQLQEQYRQSLSRAKAINATVEEHEPTELEALFDSQLRLLE